MLQKLLTTAPDSLRRADWNFRLFSGNPPLSPHVWGWITVLGRSTTKLERKWLKANGFSFWGGKWGVEDVDHKCECQRCSEESRYPLGYMQGRGAS